MEVGGQELDFYKLCSITNNAEFLTRAREFEKIILREKKSLAVYRLALELDHRGFSTKRLERHIIAIGEPKYLIRYARDIRVCSTSRIEEALLKLDCAPFLWAMFAIEVPGANKERIERLIIKTGNAKAAYLCLRYLNFPNIKALKKILIKSKKPRYLFALACMCKRKNELAVLQDLIIGSRNASYIRLLAKKIKGADIEKLELAVIETGNIREIRRFANELNTKRALRLSILD